MDENEPLMKNLRRIRPAAHITREARRTLSIRVELHRLGDDPQKSYEKVAELSKLSDVIVHVSKFRTKRYEEDNDRKSKDPELAKEMNENGKKMFERVRDFSEFHRIDFFILRR